MGQRLQSESSDTNGGSVLFQVLMLPAHRNLTGGSCFRPDGRLVTVDLPLNIAVWPGTRSYTTGTGGLKPAGNKAERVRVPLWHQFRVCMAIEIKSNQSLHPGLTEEFEEELGQALSIRMKLLSTPYIGLPIPDRLRKNPHIYAPEVFAIADCNERLGSVVRSIVARGVGGGALVALAREFTERLNAACPEWLSDREFIYRVYGYACASGLNKEKRQIEKAFAESAEGDVAAAHVAFGTEYLCTEVRGTSAVGPSML